MKIMLVDDSRTMRNIQKSVLAKLGHTEVTEANDGMDALSKAKADPPDLILLDWNMPNMDGLTFLKSFRQTNSEARVIMVTTEAEKARVIEAIKAGVNNYLVKPFTPDTLSSRIEETLAQAG
jgi:two-component system, chemotaxis family, chemotaxis protein CheY